MFVIYNENTKFPIKIWLEDEKQLEESCLEQAYHLSQLPFLHKWVCLMPDTHTGKGKITVLNQRQQFSVLFIFFQFLIRLVKYFRFLRRLVRLYVK